MINKYNVASFYLSIFIAFSVEYWRDLEIWVRVRSRSLKMMPTDRSYTTLYFYVVVTIALSCTILELFDVQNIVNLKSRIGVFEGHWNNTIGYIAYELSSSSIVTRPYFVPFSK